VAGKPDEREEAVTEVMRVAATLEAQGASARPILDTIVRLGPKALDSEPSDANTWVPEAHADVDDLVSVKSALQAGEIPVLLPLALDSRCRSVRVSANDVIAALIRTMAEAGPKSPAHEIDLTPMRLMVINREGGIPSYAREGLPHLLVNLSSEYEQIRETFLPQWEQSHPTALKNLALAQTCLSYMPRTSSAIIVSHRSPSELIANLITNKPVQSSSLPHALLQGHRKLTPHTPTLLRRGLPIRVIRDINDIDKTKLTTLLETSFGRVLNTEAFYTRMDSQMDFLIVAGDYGGAAIVTNEEASDGQSIAYLDKFAALPSHQGDGTADLLWVALHDESYGLGSAFARNFNEGSRQGLGTGRDLVWRSRANNPVNNWYYERSSGHLRMGHWVLFWCDAESRLKRLESESIQKDKPIPRRGVRAAAQFVVEEEQGRLDRWGSTVERIPSSWKEV
jgi:amino-acid N-acetyltransferase